MPSSGASGARCWPTPAPTACGWRASPRALQPRLLEARLARTRDRARAAGPAQPRRRSARITAPRRARLERVAGRLRPQAIGERVARCSERVRRAGRRARAQSHAERARARHRRHLEASAKLLASLSYQGVLQRGYRAGAGRARAAACARWRRWRPGQRLDIELADGQSTRRPLGRRWAASAGSPRNRATRRCPQRKAGPRGGNQGSLF